MKKGNVILALILISFVGTACSNTNETPSHTNEESEETEPVDGEEKDDKSNQGPVKNDDEEEDTNGEQEGDYTEEQVAGDYLIYGDWLDGTDFVLYFTRTTDDLTREERLRQSLIESDPSQRNLFSATTDFEVDGTVVNLYFNEEDALSMASTESAQFEEVFHEIGFRYGIEERNYFNQDGERGLVFAENRWEEPVEIEQEENRGYYVVPPEKSEWGEHTYISGAVAGEEVHTKDGELLDFNQTIDAMTTVENDEGAYYSGIYEGVVIEEAKIEGDQAIVRYHINEGGEATQQEREDFEQVLQLAALDFQVGELQIVDETDKIISVYPLLNEIANQDNDASKNMNHPEEGPDTDNEKNATLTEEEAIGNVFDYVDEQEASDLEDVKAMIQDDQEDPEKFLVQVFVYTPEDEEDGLQMTNTIGWYLVDKETGEVEEREL